MGRAGMIVRTCLFLFGSTGFHQGTGVAMHLEQTLCVRTFTFITYS